MSAKLPKSVQETSKVSASFGKNDMRYWEGKVYKPTFTEGGKKYESKQYSVKIQHRGNRRNFPLGLANRSDAAKRARDIYHSLLARGWEATLAQYRPQCAKADGPVTVGAYLAEVALVMNVAPRSLAGYQASLRMIAADVAGIAGERSKYDYKTGGRDVWLRKVDAVCLDKLTPAAIEAWKQRFIKARRGNPMEERKGRNSANSFLRQARSLFAPKIIKLVSAKLNLPEPVPFKDVSLYPRSSMRYVSRVDISQLVTSAYKQLGGPRREDEKPAVYLSRIEQFKVFLLAAFGGLRRNEIDKLLWEQIDLQQGTIEIRENAYFKPKTEESRGVIGIEPEVATLLAQFKKDSNGPFVIHASKKATKVKPPQSYRAERHFKSLIDWLQRQGVDDLKPLHVLRKEAGSLICGADGLYAASRFLRHGDIRTTAAHYIDRKSVATVGMGSLLLQSQEQDIETEAPAGDNKGSDSKAKQERRTSSPA